MARWVWVQLHGVRIGVFIGMLFCLGSFNGCSPSLNWRTVAMGRLTVLLPCKPDQAQRNVVLAAQTIAMDMVGCQADGAMFAISHVHAQDVQALDALLANWRSSALAHMRAGPSTSSSAQTLGQHPLPMLLVNTQGQDASGQAVQARLAWVRDGLDLFHMALYAPNIHDDMAKPFFSEIQAP